jgi:hypothetical protein
MPVREMVAAQAEILVRAFAKVGIIALVDEVTGYQDARARDALAKILEAYIAKELRKWVRTFPPDFYKEMFRLRGLDYGASKVKKKRMCPRSVRFTSLATSVISRTIWCTRG